MDSGRENVSKINLEGGRNEGSTQGERGETVFVCAGK